MDLQADVNKAAYELYEKRGRIDGYDLDDWLEAERIVMTSSRKQAEVEQNTRGRKTKNSTKRKS